MPVEDDPVRDVIAKRFRIYDEREEALDGAVAARMFYVMVDHATFDAQYEQIRSELKEIDNELIIFLRRQGGEDILFVAERPPFKASRNRTALTLMFLTVLTTTIQGAVYWQGYTHPGSDWSFQSIMTLSNIMWGAFTFALPLMAILGVHEAAHYIAARRHGLRSSLPYFIPLPPVIFLFGTMGAFIRMRDPLPDRKALFDVGASGPIAGFLIAIPLLIAGAWMTGLVAEEVPDLDRPDIFSETLLLQDGGTGVALLTLDNPAAGTHLFEVTSAEADWTYTATVNVASSDGSLEDSFTSTLDSGDKDLRTVTIPDGATSVEIELAWNDGLVEFGDPLLVKALDRWFDNGAYLTHPLFFAAWVGIFVTGLNLLPAGQLDGGHVARAVLGERVRFAGLLTLGFLMVMAFQFSMWFIVALFLILTGVHHPPPLNDRTPLGPRRKIMAGVTLLVLIVTFIPIPLIY